MKERMRRIAGRPFVPKCTTIPWALVIAILAVLVGAGSAGAQPCPAQQTVGQAQAFAAYPYYHHPAQEWQVLQQQPERRVPPKGMSPARLERLTDQMGAIETRLAEMEGLTADERHDLEVRLDELREQLRLLERRLAGVEPGVRRVRRRRTPPKPDWPDLNARVEELNRRREELVEQAHHREMEMEELQQHMADRHRDIENEMRGIQEEIEELMRRREELAQRAGERKAELQELRENTERRQDEINRELEEIHAQLEGVAQEMAQIERERQERRQQLLDEVRNQTEELRMQLRELNERAERLQQALNQLGDNDEQADWLRRNLDEVREQIRRIERQLEKRPPLPRRRTRMRPMAPPPTLDGACQEVVEEIEEIRVELTELQQAEGETIEALRGELEQLRQATEQIRDRPALATAVRRPQHRRHGHRLLVSPLPLVAPARACRPSRRKKSGPRGRKTPSGLFFLLPPAQTPVALSSTFFCFSRLTTTTTHSTIANRRDADHLNRRRSDR